MVQSLFERFKNSHSEKLKIINLEAIIIITDKFGSLIHTLEKELDPNESKVYKICIEKIFQKLNIIKNESNLPGYIKCSIINLIEKRKTNYQQTKYDEYMIERTTKEMENEEKITQDEINDIMKRELIDYKNFVDEEGNDKKYCWELFFLYDEKEKCLDDILEGYIFGCVDFIDKEINIKYAKDYIKGLIEFWKNKINTKEKEGLKIILFKLLEVVKYCYYITPIIYDVYAYIIYIFIINGIMKINDLKDIIKEKDSKPEEFNTVSNILKKTYDYYKECNFIEDLTNFEYIKNNKDLFRWVYNHEDKNLEKEKDED